MSPKEVENAIATLAQGQASVLQAIDALAARIAANPVSTSPATPSAEDLDALQAQLGVTVEFGQIRDIGYGFRADVTIRTSAGITLKGYRVGRWRRGQDWTEVYISARGPQPDRAENTLVYDEGDRTRMYYTVPVYQRDPAGNTILGPDGRAIPDGRTAFAPAVDLDPQLVRIVKARAAEYFAAKAADIQRRVTREAPDGDPFAG